MADVTQDYTVKWVSNQVHQLVTRFRDATRGQICADEDAEILAYTVDRNRAIVDRAQLLERPDVDRLRMLCISECGDSDGDPLSQLDDWLSKTIVDICKGPDRTSAAIGAMTTTEFADLVAERQDRRKRVGRGDDNQLSAAKQPDYESLKTEISTAKARAKKSSAESRAVAYFVDEAKKRPANEIGKGDIATAIHVHPKTLSKGRAPTLHSLMEAHRSGLSTGSVPSGSKDIDGNLEALGDTDIDFDSIDHE